MFDIMFFSVVCQNFNVFKFIVDFMFDVQNKLVMGKKVNFVLDNLNSFFMVFSLNVWVNDFGILLDDMGQFIQMIKVVDEGIIVIMKLVEFVKVKVNQVF